MTIQQAPPTGLSNAADVPLVGWAPAVGTSAALLSPVGGACWMVICVLLTRLTECSV